MWPRNLKKTSFLVERLTRYHSPFTMIYEHSFQAVYLTLSFLGNIFAKSGLHSAYHENEANEKAGQTYKISMAISPIQY